MEPENSNLLDEPVPQTEARGEDLDFTAGPFVTRRSTTDEVSSLLGSLYLTENEDALDQDNADEESAAQHLLYPAPEEHVHPGGEELHSLDSAADPEGEQEGQITQERFNELVNAVAVLKGRFSELERRCKESVTSSLNRETSLRHFVDAALAKLEGQFTSELAKLEKAVVDCLLRRDERLKKEISIIMRPTSTPINSRTAAGSTDARLVPPELTSFSQAGASPYYSKPPVRLEFPTFGPDSEAADVLNFIEQCENFLEIRPLSNPELIGTLTTVLKGPALSWWKAAKSQVRDWITLQNAFMSAFLPTDYMSEVEEKLRLMVQKPDQCLRDFAYDYRALCLKWKPDIREEELVRRILNNVNPKFAGCLRGTVTTVAELVKVGSMVEKDCTGAKEYWQKVQASSEKVGRRPVEKKTFPPKPMAGVSIVQQPGQTDTKPELLLVPIAIRGVQGAAVVDTGSTFTLIRESLWKEIHYKNETLFQAEKQRFIMADGTAHSALGKHRLPVDWHGQRWGTHMHIMEDRHLAFPVIIGLDFLTEAGIILNLARRCYGLRVGPRYTFYPFLQPSVQPSPWERVQSSVSLYYAVRPNSALLGWASPPLQEMPHATPVVYDTDYPRALQQLIERWPTVTAGILGKTTVEKHAIITHDEIPVRTRAYRVSPAKKKIIEEHVETMGFSGCDGRPSRRA
ncbi:unnamed protein product [Knipowitschia caucasica]